MEGVVHVCANFRAFAAIKAGSSVVTWGRADYGGGSSAVAPLLAEGVVQVCATDSAFAAIKADGSVVTMGEAGCGGDSSAVAPLLREGVVQVHGNRNAFSAINAVLFGFWDWLRVTEQAYVYVVDLQQHFGSYQHGHFGLEHLGQPARHDRRKGANSIPSLPFLKAERASQGKRGG
ncbi:unnamed protein product [Polarella glacialis]|uniref:Uncharacterized protein n=1 Tax=Polarella glacialis TaxID=89957 RepID=A0A813HZP6_POLGL|nr:unnamed protein product [Polarella glacialis]CAE8644650.1 unnamed protein product [Polarella glacialis]